MQVDISAINNGERRQVNSVKVNELADSIRQIGLLNPITVDKQHRLIAGGHRLAACKQLGMQTIECNVVDLNGLLAELAEIDENLMRNELHWLEADEQFARRKAIYEELYPTTKQGGDRKSSVYKNQNEIISFCSDTASKTGVSERNIELSIQRAESIIPEAKEVARQRAIPKTDGTKLARLEPVTQLAIVPKLEQGLTVDKALQELKREQRQQEIQAQIKPSEASESVDIHTCQKKYRVVYADPPWAYNDACESGGIQARGASGVYPTMSIKSICELPIKNITADDAVLFLWVTSPLLEDSFKVISAWGFTYKSSFVWDKVKHNMGHYNSVRHEFLLIATKGSCTPDKVELFDSVQSIERTEHSKKPQEFRNIIETLYPYGERIELFSRDKPDGWDVMGNMV